MSRRARRPDYLQTLSKEEEEGHWWRDPEGGVVAAEAAAMEEGEEEEEEAWFISAGLEYKAWEVLDAMGWQRRTAEAADEQEMLDVRWPSTDEWEQHLRDGRLQLKDDFFQAYMVGRSPERTLLRRLVDKVDDAGLLDALRVLRFRYPTFAAMYMAFSRNSSRGMTQQQLAEFLEASRIVPSKTYAALHAKQIFTDLRVKRLSEGQFLRLQLHCWKLVESVQSVKIDGSTYFARYIKPLHVALASQMSFSRLRLRVREERPTISRAHAARWQEALQQAWAKLVRRLDYAGDGALCKPEHKEFLTCLLHQLFPGSLSETTIAQRVKQSWTRVTRRYKAFNFAAFSACMSELILATDVTPKQALPWLSNVVKGLLATTRTAAEIKQGQASRLPASPRTSPRRAPIRVPSPKAVPMKPTDMMSPRRRRRPRRQRRLHAASPMRSRAESAASSPRKPLRFHRPPQTAEQAAKLLLSRVQLFSCLIGDGPLAQSILRAAELCEKQPLDEEKQESLVMLGDMAHLQLPLWPPVARSSAAREEAAPLEKQVEFMRHVAVCLRENAVLTRPACARQLICHLLSGRWSGETTAAEMDPQWLPLGKTKLTFTLPAAHDSGTVVGSGVSICDRMSLPYSVDGHFDWHSRTVRINIQRNITVWEAEESERPPQVLDGLLTVGPSSFTIRGTYRHGTFVLQRKHVHHCMALAEQVAHAQQLQQQPPSRRPSPVEPPASRSLLRAEVYLDGSAPMIGGAAAVRPSSPARSAGWTSPAASGRRLYTAPTRPPATAPVRDVHGHWSLHKRPMTALTPLPDGVMGLRSPTPLSRTMPARPRPPPALLKAGKAKPLMLPSSAGPATDWPMSPVRSPRSASSAVMRGGRLVYPCPYPGCHFSMCSKAAMVEHARRHDGSLSARSPR
eukprot:PLAT15209.1.p1 GENE.PLAT15209.1~~PLAT15209.1.p1  ORF type:complete len:907 (-),score=301.83 PLAT15209.1:380-3100(-)